MADTTLVRIRAGSTFDGPADAAVCSCGFQTVWGNSEQRARELHAEHVAANTRHPAVAAMTSVGTLADETFRPEQTHRRRAAMLIRWLADHFDEHGDGWLDYHGRDLRDLADQLDTQEAPKCT